MRNDQFDLLILLDDDARGEVKKFIQNGGLDYFKREFAVEDAIAIIGEKKATEFNMYRNTKKEKQFVMPSTDSFPKETAQKILKCVGAAEKRILMLCDWEWKVDTSGNVLNDALNEIVIAFESAQTQMRNEEKTNAKIVMVFYTTMLEKKVILPNSRGNILIRQKTILDWRWRDITSSVIRVKKFLADSN